MKVHPEMENSKMKTAHAQELREDQTPRWSSQLNVAGVDILGYSSSVCFLLYQQAACFSLLSLV